MEKIFYNFKKNNYGFTLVEMLVSATIFVVVVLMIFQIYFHVTRSERISYLLLMREKNIHYALETMARAMRMGEFFSVGADNTSINFTTHLGGGPSSMQYRLNNYRLEQNIGGSWVSVIDPEKIEIDFLRFIINRPINSQLRITITMRGFSEIYGRRYPIRIQTSITPRILQF